MSTVKNNYWDKLMATDEGAANYMESYGEGPGCETRKIIGSFINDGETVLDVGCGPGWNLDHFDTYGPKVSRYSGIDYSERFVRVANQRWADKLGVNWTKPPFIKGDCRQLLEGDESWDVVILQDVLEHTNGFEGPVLEALRVARKRVIVTFWRKFNSKEEHDINDDGDDGYGATYSGKLWYDFLHSLPYSYVETETSKAANRWHQYFVIDKEEKRSR